MTWSNIRQLLFRGLAALESKPLLSDAPIGCSENVGHNDYGEFLGF
jgi:hypothetical protein